MTDGRTDGRCDTYMPSLVSIRKHTNGINPDALLHRSLSFRYRPSAVDIRYTVRHHERDVIHVRSVAVCRRKHCFVHGFERIGGVRASVNVRDFVDGRLDLIGSAVLVQIELDLHVRTVDYHTDSNTPAVDVGFVNDVLKHRIRVKREDILWLISFWRVYYFVVLVRYRVGDLQIRKQCVQVLRRCPMIVTND